MIFVFVFGYYEIQKTFKSIVIIFSMSFVFLKSIDMFLKCSWILEFLFQKSLAALHLTSAVNQLQSSILQCKYLKPLFCIGLHNILDLYIGCPFYYLTSWRKSGLIQKPSVQISKTFHQYGIVERTKMYSDK